MIGQKVLDRFWDKVDIQGKDDCWEWIACINSDGYGYIGYEKKVISAHRLSWMIHNGIIPEGLCVLHHCDNPPCINPAHLFLGTHTDNMRDAVNKGRNKLPCLKGEAHSQAKLTEKKVLKIRREYKNQIKKSLQALSKKYNVSCATIWLIVTRKTWQHI